MNICLLGTVAGTIQNFREKLVIDLVKRGHVVYIFAIDFDELTEEYVYSLGAVPVSYTMSRTGLNPIRDFFSLVEIYRLLDSLSIDSVFCYTVKPVIYGSIAAKFSGVKLIISMLEGLGYPFTVLPEGIIFKQKIVKKIQILLYRFSFRFIDKLIFLNADDKFELMSEVNFPDSRTHLLGGIGVDFSEYMYTQPPTERVSFIFVGRLLREKGVKEFVDAAIFLKSKYSDVDFVILGGLDLDNPGGLSKKELEHLVLSGCIVYPGYVDNVSEWISNSSVFVLPSYREGCPMSTQEAMALGRAIITTDVPGCRDTVVNGFNGYIIPPWSSKELSDAMEKFLSDRQLIVRMGLNSLDIAKQRYNVHDINDKIISILTSPKPS